jgi:predicted nucleotidyltransferase
MNLEQINTHALHLARQALANGLPGQPPARFVFLTLSGAHLYGFPSPDSDLDLRGAHMLPLEEVIGLGEPAETHQVLQGEVEGVALDCVSHDLRKYLRLLTRKNGYVLEQIFSPLVVFDGGHLTELRRLARGAMTKHVAHHYRGFLRNQEQLARQEEVPHTKTLLYLFRIAMTGIHLLRTGEVQASLPVLNETVFKCSYIAELIARKMSSSEQSVLSSNERRHLLREAQCLAEELDEAAASSSLPEHVENREALNDFLIRFRRDTD